MLKILLSIILFTITIYSEDIKEEASEKETAQSIIKKISQNPEDVSHKKIKKDFKSININELKLDINNGLIEVTNKEIEMKNIIADGYINSELYSDIKNKIERIEINSFYKKYLKDIENISSKKDKTELTNLVHELEEKTISVISLKTSLITELHKKELLQKSYIDDFEINDLIVSINSKYNIDSINMGKTIVFSVLLFIFLIIGFTFNHFIHRLFFRVCKFEDTEDDIEEQKELETDIKIIKFPILFLFLSIGMQIGVEIINYPNPINENLSLLFSILNTINIVVIFVRSVDLFFFVGIKKGHIKIKRFELVNLFIRISKIFIILIGIFYLLTLVGINTNRLLASLGIGSLAIAYATKDFISRFFSGIKLILDKNFSAGDWVKINTIPQEGTIMDIGLMNTTLRTFDNALLVIPNSIITNESYINWNRRKIGRKIGMKIGIKYDSKKEDIKNAIAEIKEMLRTNMNISPYEANFNKKRISSGKVIELGNDLGLKNTLFVNLSEFGDSAIIIDIYAFSRSVVWGEWRETKEEIMFNIMDIIKNNNLEFAFPSQSIYLESMESIKD